LSNQLIAVEQTIPFQLNAFSAWCDGALAEEYTEYASDFMPGFEISAYFVDDSALKTNRSTIPSRKYPYINESIGFNEGRYLMPVNYYGNPPYLLEGSIISLECKIYVPESVDDISYAIVHFFDSRDKAVSYQQWEGSSVPIYSIDVKDCVKAICAKKYNITKSSFYFPVFSTKADSKYHITVNFAFEVIYYIDPSNLPSAVNFANISKNSSARIPFRPSKVLLLYAHPPSDNDYRRLAHVKFSCVRHYAVIVPVLVVLVILEAAGLVAYFYCCIYVKNRKKNYSQPRETEIPQTLSEDAPLINSDTQ
jgi:hypothetical protein